MSNRSTPERPPAPLHRPPDIPRTTLRRPGGVAVGHGVRAVGFGFTAPSQRGVAVGLPTPFRRQTAEGARRLKAKEGGGPWEAIPRPGCCQRKCTGGKGQALDRLNGPLEDAPRPVPLVRLLAGGHPPGGHDVRPLPTVAAQRPQDLTSREIDRPRLFGLTVPARTSFCAASESSDQKSALRCPCRRKRLW